MSIEPAGFAPDEFPAAGLLEERPDGAATCSCTSETLSSPAGEIHVLHVGGEVDLLTSPILTRALDAQLQRCPRHLIVDLAQLTFCSVRGMSQLVQAGATATDRGIGYAVSGTPPWLGRIWTTCWPTGQVPAGYTDLATAITALRAHDTP